MDTSYDRGAYLNFTKRFFCDTFIYIYLLFYTKYTLFMNSSMHVKQSSLLFLGWAKNGSTRP